MWNRAILRRAQGVPFAGDMEDRIVAGTFYAPMEIRCHAMREVAASPGAGGGDAGDVVQGDACCSKIKSRRGMFGARKSEQILHWRAVTRGTRQDELRAQTKPSAAILRAPVLAE